MRMISISKARATISTEPVKSMTIIMSSEFPETNSLEHSRAIHIKDGKDLADALCTTLPGGTLDQLICELMTRRASLLRVPMFDKKEE